ncbi:advillin-like isoform X2 [Oratosquilla oratoria]|uniref:advillin-like isoform X2 n=1 Tax=Oratosquilla oratoria TaxID=337810 RepID=UPI003F76E9F9
MVQDAVKDPAFFNIPQQTTGFLVWRVENLGLTAMAREQFGKFHRGDSYLVLAMAEPGKALLASDPPRPARSSLDIHIHFWLGSETSQDEAGVAAIKAVELDVLLGGSPVQHRETEGSESKKFLSYFKSGIRVLKGGVASGFRHVTDDFKPTLYHCKGKRTCVVRELNEVSWGAMNDGDVYVLDTKTIMFVWTGRTSNNMEKIQGAKFAGSLREEHGGGSVVVIEDGQEQGLPEDEKKAFNQHLPLNNKQVIPATKAPKDEAVARRLCEELKLFKCSDADGTLKVTEVKHGPLFQTDLDSNDSFIVDNGRDGIWVWVGKRATAKERQEAMRNAQGFVKKKEYPQSTPVTRVIDGGEPGDFKTLFRNWRDKAQSVGFGRQVSTSKVAKTVQTTFDAESLHAQPAMAAKCQMMDDGSGQKEVWRVRKFDLVEVPESNHGEFYMGDCYVILYAYLEGNSEHYLIYYWIGNEASSDEAGTAALKSVELDQKLSGRAVQVRVTQAKEPPHFMAIFKGKLIIYKGGFSSSFDGVDGRDVSLGDRFMLHVRGTTQGSTKAIQVDFRAASLNSNDCFLVVTPQGTQVWCGKGSTGDERELAKSLAKGRGEVTVVSEGSEKSDFWKLLGGKEEYASGERLKVEDHTMQVRLFQCSNASGVFEAEEVVSFTQEDLVDDDVMLLDAWDTIFLWIGINSNKVEQRESEKLAMEYLRTDPAGRDKGTPIVRLKQGYEPPNFTGFFGAWDNDLWNNNMTYADICDRLKEASPGATVLVSSSGVGNDGGRTYPLVTLQEKDPDKLPEGVDPTQKEDYLSDAEFTKAFGCSKDEFTSLPKWKRVNLKKKAGLF